MSVRVVLDTNVIISAALTPGPPALCVEMALKGIVTLVVSEELLEEYAEVLARPRLRLPNRYVRRYLAELRARAILVSPAPIPTGITHEDDRHVLACAVGGRADVLVTGNLRHFPRHFRHTRILAPAQLLAELIAGGES